MKIDLHCHSFYSNDGFSSPEKLIKSAIKKGLDGIALTDHNTISGWKEAIEGAKKLNALLILGEEIKTKRNGKIVGDVLGLFLKKEIKAKEPEKVMKEIKEQEGIVIIPHPFHPLERFRENLEKYLELIDGIEVLNSRLPFSFFDKKALDFAQKHNLSIVSGSDAHFYKFVGTAYTIAEAKTLEEFKEAILKRKTRIEGKKSSFLGLILPSLARIKNTFK